jgi:phospholipase C
MVRTRLTSLAGALAVAVVGTGIGMPSAASASSGASGIHKIKHVVVIMQENRSFDSYFGTYPNADGIPRKNGKPSPCLPNSKSGKCERPYADHADVNGGGPHSQDNASADVNGGKMNGFVDQATNAQRGCSDPTNPACANTNTPDVMGYHPRGDIPNYWSFADDYVLQDHMFEPNASWSLPEHLFQVSEWSANCTQHDNPSSCTNALQAPGLPPDFGGRRVIGQRRPDPIYAWTDLTYLLHQNQVSWGYLSSTEPNPTVRTTPQCRARPCVRTPRRRASGPHCRTSTPSAPTESSETSSPSTTSMAPPRRAACRPCPGWCRRTP